MIYAATGITRKKAVFNLCLDINYDNKDVYWTKDKYKDYYIIYRNTKITVLFNRTLFWYTASARIPQY